jgi:biotin carboxylase
MKKILVLGTGNAQTDFIQYCKEIGLEVHCCSYKNEGRGIQYSDYFEITDISDVENVRAYALDHKIDLIYSTGSEIAMPTISKVSEDLTLPVFNSFKTTTLCQNKNLLRDAFSDFPEFTVNYKFIKTFDSLKTWNKFPAVVKPNDSQGQRGITIVERESELKNAFERAVSHSPSRSVIIEEFIDGFEISVNTYVLNGKPCFMFITERISFDQYPGGIIKSHKYPVSKYVNEDKVWQLLNSSLKRLGIINGPAYFQLKIGKTGNPKVIEVTPRLDGCHLWRMIYLIREIHLFQIIINHLLTGIIEEKCFQKSIKLNDYKKASLDFFTQAPSSFFEKSKHITSQNASYIEWYYSEGEIIPVINGFAEKTGYQITLEK